MSQPFELDKEKLTYEGYVRVMELRSKKWKEIEEELTARYGLKHEHIDVPVIEPGTLIKFIIAFFKEKTFPK